MSLWLQLALHPPPPHSLIHYCQPWGRNKCLSRGGSRIFILIFFFFGGGGGRKRLCARTHITSAEPNSLSEGVQGPLKGPGSSRVVIMLSRAIWALFLSILIKLGLIKYSWSKFRGARACCAPPPPLDPPLLSHTSIADHSDGWRGEEQDPLPEKDVLPESEDLLPKEVHELTEATSGVCNLI